MKLWCQEQGEKRESTRYLRLRFEDLVRLCQIPFGKRAKTDKAVEIVEAVLLSRAREMDDDFDM